MTLPPPQKLAIAVAAVLLIAAAIFWGVQNIHAQVGNLQIFNGTAELVRSGNSSPGNTGTGIRLHDHIKTGAGSRVAIVLKDGTVIRLEENTEIDIAQLDYRGKTLRTAVISLVTGRAWSHVSPQAAGSQFEVETPTVVASVRGTSFNVDYSPTLTGVYVYRHMVNVQLHSGSQASQDIPQGDLLQGDNSSLAADFQAGPVLAPNAFIDDWIRFNQEKDDQQDGFSPATAASSTPLSTSSPSPTSAPTLAAEVSPALPTPSPSSLPTSTSTPRPSAAASPTPAITPTPTPTLPPRTLSSIVLSADQTTVTVKQPVTFTASARYSDQTFSDVTSQIPWTQYNSSSGTFSANVFTPTTAGQVPISVSWNGVTSNVVTITVQPPTLTGISLSYAVVDPRKRTAQATATAQYSDGSTQDVTSQASWKITTASPGATITSTGFYTAGRTTTVTITATFGSQTGSVQITL